MKHTDPLDESRDYDVDRLIDESNEAARLEEKGRLLKLRIARELDKRCEAILRTIADRETKSPATPQESDR